MSAILCEHINSVAYAKYAPVAHHDKIPILLKCQKYKAKCRVRFIPTKRNGVYLRFTICRYYFQEEK